jgi:hypothetical protein
MDMKPSHIRIEQLLSMQVSYDDDNVGKERTGVSCVQRGRHEGSGHGQSELIVRIIAAVCFFFLI